MDETSPGAIFSAVPIVRIVVQTLPNSAVVGKQSPTSLSPNEPKLAFELYCPNFLNLNFLVLAHCICVASPRSSFHCRLLRTRNSTTLKRWILIHLTLVPKAWSQNSAPYFPFLSAFSFLSESVDSVGPPIFTY
jgi:hypothetical protein